MINESPLSRKAGRGFVFSNHPKQADFYMTFLLVNFAVKNATVFFPFLLSRTGLTISVSLLPVSDAVQCNRPCSAVQPSLQCSATVPAVQCNRSCSALHPSLQCTVSSHTCNLSRKYLQPSLHVLATAPESTCGKRRHYLGISSPSPTISLLCLLAYCRACSRELRVGIICHADGCQGG